MQKPWILFGGGLVTGFVVLLVVGALAAPKLMLVEKVSPYGLEETVNKIVSAAEAAGWNVSSVAKLDESVKKHGGAEVLPVRQINLCQASYASTILADDQARIASVMMPCTISVYTKSDGKTYVGTMNPGIMGKVFGGTIAKVMGGPVAVDQAAFVSFLQ